MKKNIPSISVIVPTFNREKEISQCLLSILNQSFKNWELIISDNASTDNTVSIVKEIVQDDCRCRLIENPINIGPTLNWLTGVRNANAHWVKIVYSDDYLLPSALENFYEATKHVSPHSFILDGQEGWKSDQVSSSGFLWHNIVTHKLYLVSPTLALFPKKKIIGALTAKLPKSLHNYGMNTGAGFDLLCFLLCCDKVRLHSVLDKRYTECGRSESSITLNLYREKGTKIELKRQYFATQLWFSVKFLLFSSFSIKNFLFCSLLACASASHWLRSSLFQKN